MKKKYPKIIFIGSDDFSLTSLNHLLKYNYNIIAIITHPDKVIKKKTQISSLKILAVNKKIKLFQPSNLHDIIFIKEIKQLSPDIQIVVSFKILPKKLWKIPKLGTFNLHPSLLPKYKGPCPINWVIINGEKTTGVTTFFINEKIDSGSIILQNEIIINKHDTYGDLYKRLSMEGAILNIKTINFILLNNNKNLFYASKIIRKTCEINWNNKTLQIYNQIRGLNPTPGAWTVIKDTISNKTYEIKIFDVIYKLSHQNITYGKINIQKSNMKISCQDGFIYVMTAQILNKKKLTIKDIINGIPNKQHIIIK